MRSRLELNSWFFLLLPVLLVIFIGCSFLCFVVCLFTILSVRRCVLCFLLSFVCVHLSPFGLNSNFLWMILWTYQHFQCTYQHFINIDSKKEGIVTIQLKKKGGKKVIEKNFRNAAEFLHFVEQAVSYTLIFCVVLRILFLNRTGIFPIIFYVVLYLFSNFASPHRKW